MSDDLIFSFADEIPEGGNPIQTDELACKVCGTPLEYSGRGGKPKYCDEHRPYKKVDRSAGGGVRAGRAGGVTVDRAINELTMLYGMGGQVIKFVQPITGEAIYENREKLAESYRLLLETNARFRKMFADIEAKAAWLPIIAVHGDLIGAIWLARKIDKMKREEAEAAMHIEYDTVNV